MTESIPVRRGDRLLRLRGVQDRVPFGKSKIYDMISKGEFPAPQKIGGCSCWWESAIDSWLEERVLEASVG